MRQLFILFVLVACFGCHSTRREVLKFQATAPVTKLENGVVQASFEVEIKQ